MVFAEALEEYLVGGLSDAIAQAEEPAPPVPLVADRYVALSALQKAIRRGHQELALRAAMNLMIGGPTRTFGLFAVPAQRRRSAGWRDGHGQTIRAT